MSTEPAPVQLVLVSADVQVLADWLEERGYPLPQLRTYGVGQRMAEAWREAYRLGQSDARTLELARRAVPAEQVARWLIAPHTDERAPSIYTHMRTPRGLIAWRFLYDPFNKPRPVLPLERAALRKVLRNPGRAPVDGFADWDSVTAWTAAREWLTGILDDLGLLEVRP